MYPPVVYGTYRDFLWQTSTELAQIAYQHHEFKFQRTLKQMWESHKGMWSMVWG